jgi:hypothetical protein
MLHFHQLMQHYLFVLPALTAWCGTAFALVALVCRVGDYEFICHLHTCLLEPADPQMLNSHNAVGQRPQALQADTNKGDRKLFRRGSSKAKPNSVLDAISKAAAASTSSPALTSKYIRVCNTFDIVPHIPPTWANVYQHGGDLVYLRVRG